MSQELYISLALLIKKLERINSWAKQKYLVELEQVLLFLFEGAVFLMDVAQINELKSCITKFLAGNLDFKCN